MYNLKIKKGIKNGLILATAAGSILLSTTSVASNNQDKGEVKKCIGANKCRGQSVCSTRTNGCAGLNSCKGQGWLPLTEKECAKAGGKAEDFN